MKYLIMECKELMDQYECDADRTPITIVDDWKEWFDKAKPDYMFEVYELKNDKFRLIKGYNDVVEEGMAFIYYPDNEYISVIKKYPGLDRYSNVPQEIMERAVNGEDYRDKLSNWGYISWIENDILYGWTEYIDNQVFNCY